jgi:hypothetical protein
MTVNDESATLDISSLPSGFYVLRIATTNGCTYRKLMKKN